MSLFGSHPHPPGGHVQSPQSNIFKSEIRSSWASASTASWASPRRSVLGLPPCPQWPRSHLPPASLVTPCPPRERGHAPLSHIARGQCLHPPILGGRHSLLQLHPQPAPLAFTDQAQPRPRPRPSPTYMISWLSSRPSTRPRVKLCPASEVPGLPGLILFFNPASLAASQ